MKSLRSIALTTAIASFIAAPAAFAQDGGDTASGKRFSVVGSATILQPDSDPLPGARIDADGDVAPTLSATYHVTDNIGVELWGAADKFNHRVRGDGGKIGTVDSQPIALSGQYHFGDADQTFRPFVGLGYHQTNISDEDIATADGSHVGLTSPKGAIGTVGVDMNINPTWFARADARYLHGDADAKLAGQTVERDVRYNPWTVGIGLGARF
ncbi:OmpW family outer membrane protein [Luteimonas sp. M1R5S18]|jgi:outer membrane protein|uniref:OmpW family outer membrane protein n=1 Tax=Luteimonas rhizosphaericola TaxID=3042024 RepID=A0ABT6JNP2_9GAMM|nr:OmpW family outer membrane protein [Luteimonas rhizosphaericola]MDH5831591.1 OmpW family outer membrane protein [Luteimonas rhizosphaericola]